MSIALYSLRQEILEQSRKTPEADIKLTEIANYDPEKQRLMNGDTLGGLMPEYLLQPEGGKVTKPVENLDKLTRAKDRAAISEINCPTARKEANERRKRELEEKKRKQKAEDMAAARENHILFSSVFKKEDWDAFIEKWYGISAARQAKKKYDQDEERNRRERAAAELFQKDNIAIYSYIKQVTEEFGNLASVAEQEYNQMVPYQQDYITGRARSESSRIKS